MAQGVLRLMGPVRAICTHEGPSGLSYARGCAILVRILQTKQACSLRQGRCQDESPAIFCRMPAVHVTLRAMRPYLLVAGAGLLLFLVVCVPFYLVIGVYVPLSKDPSDWATFATYVGGILGPALTFISVLLVLYTIQKRDQEAEAKTRRAESELLMQEAIKTLGRAYETFTRLGDKPPKNDRLLWLSAARMVVRYKSMRQRISEQDHQEIADENEEYIRLRFYTLLHECKDLFTVQYFMPNGDVIARKSIAVIFDFAKWRDGIEDPLEKIDDQELFAKGAVPIDFLGVEGYLGHFQAYWEEVERRKAGAN